MKLNRAATADVIEEIRRSVSSELSRLPEEPDPDAVSPKDFAAARVHVRYLGAHVLNDTRARFGFWTPEVVEERIDPEMVVLEMFTPDLSFELTMKEQRIPVSVETVPTVRDGEFTWAVVDGVTAGNSTTIGTLYRLRFIDRSGTVRHVYDPLASSVPFGAAAPAELYDIEGMLSRRRDVDHFPSRSTSPDPDGTPRVNAPVSLLEIHIATATRSGTIAGLTREYRRIAEELNGGTPIDQLRPSDKALAGYEAIQLMPIEPTILYESGPTFWIDHGDGTITLRRPDTTNWGYDVITAASPAPNPVLLESGRPDELMELIETLHTFPGGAIHIVFDIVYGHADNQALHLLNRHFFAGANMYGQNLNYRHPVVRAMLLEMQRRKSNYGVDGIRVDGAQDFKYWVSGEDALYHDDEYLRLMNDLKQEAAGVEYRPWMVFEDGRPWPRDDWELASSYHEVTRTLPRVVQWGPLTFAHNTPFLFTFWIGKWWRIREILESGAHWITGNSNHDTLRRGTQVHPDAMVNTYLGTTLPEVFENGYDNGVSRLFDMFLPGIPMDFLNANLRGPWSFMRNTDATWAIKVVSEETWFLDWNVSPDRFVQPWAFSRLKQLGFRSLAGLKQFIRALDGAVRTGRYDADSLAEQLNSVRPRLEGPSRYTGEDLFAVARAWMDDVHEFCNLDHYRSATDGDPFRRRQRRFALEVLLFRRRERWLAGNFSGSDTFDYLHPAQGSVVVAGYRHRPEVVAVPDGPLPLPRVAPDSRWSDLCFVANLEGAPRRVVPAEHLPAEVAAAKGLRDEGPDGGGLSGGWQPLLVTPRLAESRGEAIWFDEAVPLANGHGVLFGYDPGSA
ncbi:MAG: glucosylglycerol hydrolase [Alkalispirochaeta sp.]